MTAQLSVIVPNYKTPELTRICLRLLRKYTEPGKIKVIVIDNDSRDDSVEYLRRLKWITLLERQVPEGEPGFVMHARALDEAFARVDTPYVMIMHTDTFMLRPDWLDYVLGHFDSDKVAAIGSWKLEEPRSFLWRAGHFMEECFNKLRQKKVKHEAPYLRSHFAVYRSDLIRQYTNGFYDGLSAGKMLHLKLAAAGFELLFLSTEELSRFVCHLNHATMILNPARNDRKTGKAPARKKLSKKMRLFMDILDSEDLDL